MKSRMTILRPAKPLELWNPNELKKRGVKATNLPERQSKRQTASQKNGPQVQESIKSEQIHKSAADEVKDG
ncbi:hypothetical protein HAX54_053096 [Datura stramonium]|uniref:Uncharacterized protein n=1 Tax=Datura stramonium TaxID=4076 RepID=A0ABS8WT03_DATST|nr:hypothetical protein [Datura stramonium]